MGPEIGRVTFKIGFALLTVFFLYRDGESLLAQSRSMLLRRLGNRVEGYPHAIGVTMRAVLYGLILTAQVQGALAGLGYWAADVRAPVLLDTVTVLLALVPFGAPRPEGWSACGWCGPATFGLARGSLYGVPWWSARPTTCCAPWSSAVPPAFPICCCCSACWGGISAFGLVGLFLGPVVITVLLAVWREWLLEDRSADQVRTAQSPRSAGNSRRNGMRRSRAGSRAGSIITYFVGIHQAALLA